MGTVYGHSPSHNAPENFALSQSPSNLVLCFLPLSIIHITIHKAVPQVFLSPLYCSTSTSTHPLDFEVPSNSKSF